MLAEGDLLVTTQALGQEHGSSRVRPAHTRLEKGTTKMVTKSKVLVLLSGAAAIGLASLTLVHTGIGSARGSDASGGPVVYLNHKGAASDCEIAVTATTDTGRAYFQEYSRPNCDGGMMLPVLRLNSRLTVEADSEESDAGGELIVSDRLDVSKLSAGGPGYVTNSTAICFLVNNDGSIVFTKASDQPNSRPCAFP